MTSENAELKALRERMGAIEITLASLNAKAERIPELVISLEKLEIRIRGLEDKKGQLDDIVAYKNTSDARITSLEQTKWYYKGGLNTIAVLLLTSGVIGVCLGIIVSKSWFHT